MIALFLGFVLASPLISTAPDDEAVALATRTAAAVEEAPSLSFNFERSVLREDGTRRVLLRGTGRASSSTADRGALAYLEGELLEEEDGTPVPFLLWSNGEDVRVHDGTTRTVWTSPMHRGGSHLTEHHGRGVVGPLVASATYHNLAVYGPELRAPTEQGGAECRVLSMALPSGGEYLLFVGAEDSLPRHMVKPEGDERVALSWGELVVGDRPAAVPAAPEVPEGWEERSYAVAIPAIGEPAPDFELVDRDGDRHDLGALRGRVVLLDFWASWCAPCIASMPGLQALADDLSDRGVVVLGARWSDGGDATALLERLGVGYPIVEGGAIAEAYGVDRVGLPALFVIDPRGRLVDAFLGYQGEATESRLRRVVEGLLP